ncbi:MAG TPA: RDD family protein [Vicinamibacterales bacterium]|nr:RDD family protein [Vicinamibacterales bacterium]
MKCPKCAYLGFETVERCRNCGYDFSLSVHMESPPELPLQQSAGAGAPLADFDLSGLDTAGPSEMVGGLDFGRVIGAVPIGVGLAEPEPEPPAPRQASRASDTGLPLFSPAVEDEPDDAPLITSPRPVRAPLSVRRATPDLTRGRRTPRTQRRDDDLALHLEPASDELVAPALAGAAEIGLAPATGSARLIAAVIDVLLLGAIDAAIIYLTVAIAGLTLAEASVLPRIPLAAFLVLLNGGYLVTFIAASGQTIGKMIAGVRVVGDDGRRVDVPGAVLRAGGCALTVLTAGLGYLPAFVTADGRALQDRIAGTVVVKT